jgi:hypothetical protein
VMQRSTASSSSSKGPSRPSSRLGSISGAIPLPTQSTAAGGHRRSSAASERASNASGAVTPLHRPTSASTAYTGTPSHPSPLTAAAAAQMLRSMSNLSSSSGVLSSSQAAGVLAAAGLLQVSPGCYVPTPPLLEKLLSRAGGPNRPNNGWPAWLSQNGSAGTPAAPAPTAVGSGSGIRDSSADAAAAACGEGSIVGGVQVLGGAGAVQPSYGSAAETAAAAGHGQQKAASGVASQQGHVVKRQQASACSGGTAQLGVAAPAAAGARVSTSEVEAHVGSSTEQQQGLLTASGSCAEQRQQQQHPEDQVPPDIVAVIKLPLVGPIGPLKPVDSCCAEPVIAADALADVDSTPAPQLAALASSKSHRATVDAVPYCGTAVLPLAAHGNQQAMPLPLELPAEAVVPLATAAAVPTPGHHAAAGAGGGFGRILVRRKFVKNLQPTAPHFKRYDTGRGVCDTSVLAPNITEGKHGAGKCSTVDAHTCPASVSYRTIRGGSFYVRRWDNADESLLCCHWCVLAGATPSDAMSPGSCACMHALVSRLHASIRQRAACLHVLHSFCVHVFCIISQALQCVRAVCGAMWHTWECEGCRCNCKLPPGKQQP